MKPNEVYFYRTRGSWDWTVYFEITKYSNFWRSNLNLLTKLRISAFALTQKIFGPFVMWTNVDFSTDVQKVRHSTMMRKWGISFYRSEKTIFLESDGHGLRLEGAEYFWPLIFRAVPFQPVFGAVDISTTQASYKMPLAGAFCDCQTYLGQANGYMDISTPWLRGRFALNTDSSMIFASRFE